MLCGWEEGEVTSYEQASYELRTARPALFVTTFLGTNCSPFTDHCSLSVRATE